VTYFEINSKVQTVGFKLENKAKVEKKTTKKLKIVLEGFKSESQKMLADQKQWVGRRK
jgi:hypothetical protein